MACDQIMQCFARNMYIKLYGRPEVGFNVSLNTFVVISGMQLTIA